MTWRGLFQTEKSVGTLQFLDKPLPYFLVKKTVDSIWKQFGKVNAYLLENGMYIFRFEDEC